MYYFRMKYYIIIIQNYQQLYFCSRIIVVIVFVVLHTNIFFLRLITVYCLLISMISTQRNLGSKYTTILTFFELIIS